jgi:hypothetical protein
MINIALDVSSEALFYRTHPKAATRIVWAISLVESGFPLVFAVSYRLLRASAYSARLLSLSPYFGGEWAGIKITAHYLLPTATDIAAIFRPNARAIQLLTQATQSHQPLFRENQRAFA